MAKKIQLTETELINLIERMTKRVLNEGYGYKIKKFGKETPGELMGETIESLSDAIRLCKNTKIDPYKVDHFIDIGHELECWWNPDNRKKVFIDRTVGFVFDRNGRFLINIYDNSQNSTKGPSFDNYYGESDFEPEDIGGESDFGDIANQAYRGIIIQWNFIMVEIYLSTEDLFTWDDVINNVSGKWIDENKNLDNIIDKLTK